MRQSSVGQQVGEDETEERDIKKNAEHPAGEKPSTAPQQRLLAVHGSSGPGSRKKSTQAQGLLGDSMKSMGLNSSQMSSQSRQDLAAQYQQEAPAATNAALEEFIASL